MSNFKPDLSTLMESTYDAILVICGGRITYVNRRMEEMLGYDPGELLGVRADAIFPPVIADKTKTDKPGTYSPTCITRYNTDLICKNNHTLAADITALPGDWDTMPASFLIVRERKKNDLERSLSPVKTRPCPPADDTTGLFFIYDLGDDKTVYAGVPHEQFLSRPDATLHDYYASILDRIHPDDRDHVSKIITQKIRDLRNISDFECRIAGPDGSVRWNRNRVFPLLNNEGDVTHVAGIIDDITEQKLNENDLELSRAQLRQIIDLVPHPIFVKDYEGRFLLVNKTKADMYGMTVEQLTGMLQRDCDPQSEQLTNMQASDQKVLSNNGSLVIPEESFIDTTGKMHTLHTTKIPFAIAEGTPKAVLGVGIDITDRKLAEYALSQSEDRLRRALHYANIGSWDWDIETGALYWSERVAPLFGRDTGAMKTSYDAFLSAVHPDDVLQVEEAIKLCLETGCDYDIEHRIMWPDGSIHWLHESGGVVYNSDGMPAQMLGVVRDITQRKLAEQALSDSERRYRAVMENASDAILLGTMEGWIIDANRRAEELLGHSRNELLQMHSTQIHPPEDHPALAAAFHDLATKGSSLYEHLVLRKDGSTVNVEVAATTITHQDEKFVMAIFRDTTTRKRAEEERLALAKAQRDTLVREVHHRIKNNLQGVVGLLRRHITNRPDLRNSLEAAISQVNAMAVVHGLHGRRSNGHIVLCDMVSAICSMTGSLTGKNIEPHVAIEVDSPVRVSDDEAVPLALILNELIFNSVKHEKNAGQTVQVHVRSNSTEALVRILTPAMRLPDGFDFKTGEGLGTGLQLVKSLLPSEGCQLRLENESAGVIAELRLSPPVILP